MLATAASANTAARELTARSVSSLVFLLLDQLIRVWTEIRGSHGVVAELGELARIVIEVRWKQIVHVVVVVEESLLQVLQCLLVFVGWL